jgi:hypothetical protein
MCSLHSQHGHIVASGGNIDERKQAGFDPVQQVGCGIKGLLDKRFEPVAGK